MTVEAETVGGAALLLSLMQTEIRQLTARTATIERKTDQLMALYGQRLSHGPGTRKKRGRRSTHR